MGHFLIFLMICVSANMEFYLIVFSVNTNGSTILAWTSLLLQRGNGTARRAGRRRIRIKVENGQNSLLLGVGIIGIRPHRGSHAREIL